jgi:hypothetical protein
MQVNDRHTFRSKQWQDPSVVPLLLFWGACYLSHVVSHQYAPFILTILQLFLNKSHFFTLDIVLLFTRCKGPTIYLGWLFVCTIFPALWFIQNISLLNVYCLKKQLAYYFIVVDPAACGNVALVGSCIDVVRELISWPHYLSLPQRHTLAYHSGICVI